MAYARSRSTNSGYSSSGDLFYFVTKDNPTPLYKAKVASGQLICNDYYSCRYQSMGPTNVLNTGFHAWQTLGLPWLDLRNTVGPTGRALLTGSSAWTEYGIKNLVQSAFNKCGATILTPTINDWEVHHTELSAALNTGITSILVTLGEMNKTIRMLNKALRLLRNPLVNAKNKLRLTRAQLRTPQGRKALLEMAEEDWLEGRYGWRPFIYDTMSQFDAAKSRYSERRTVKTKVSDSDGTLTEVKTYTTTGVPPLIRSTKWQSNCIASCGQTADFSLNFSQFARVWGALDLVGTAWELTRFSFILDWFINLGDVLKALQVFAYIDERIGWNKISSEVVVVREWTYPPLGMYGTILVDAYVNKHPRSVERVKLSQRTAVTSFVPALGMSFNVDCAKTLDLLAIIHQLVRGR